MRVWAMILALAVAACGGAGQDAATMSEEAFLAECGRTYAETGGDAASAEAFCAEQWGVEQSNRALADAALTVVAAAPADAAAVPALLPAVTWAEAPEAGAMASGTLDPLSVRVQENPTLIVFHWAGVGEPVPYDAKYALEARGVAFESVACQAFGVSESTEVFVATPRRGAPFGVTIARREAPTANAHAFYTVTIDWSGETPTTESVLAPARAQNDTSWAESCEASNAQYQ